VLILVLAFLIFAENLILASPLYDIENLDDLIDAYYDGLIDYGTFAVLYDAYNLGGLSGSDLEALKFSEGFELNDFLMSPDTTDFWSRLLSGYRGRFGARTYSRNSENIYDDYYGEVSSESFEAELAVREYGNRYSLRKRTIGWYAGQFSLSLGDYLADEGYGLTIGRFDYRPSAGLDSDKSVDFWYPEHNYYNGLKFSTHSNMLGGRVYYSDKKYDASTKKFFGISGDFNYGSFKGGLAVGASRYDDNSGFDERQAAGVNAEYSADAFTLGAEYAQVDGSAGAYLRALKKFTGWRIESEFWHYADHFENYNCSGESAADYHTFYPTDGDIGFRSSQAGETGMAIVYSSPVYSAGMQLWSQNYDDVNSSLYVRYSKDISNDINQYFQASFRNRGDSEYLWLKSTFNSRQMTLRRVGVKLYLKENEFANGACYVFTYLNHNLNEGIEVFLQLRDYFDGQWSWYIGEDFEAGWGINLRVEVSYRNSTRINIRAEKIL
jgi:hypothetical protein